MPVRTLPSLLDPRRSYTFVAGEKHLRGSCKKILFTTDDRHAIAFYLDGQSPAARDRLQRIILEFAQKIFSGPAGDYCRDLFCWPEDLVDDGDKTAVVLPRYKPRFLFQQGFARSGALAGRTKEAHWFLAARFRSMQSPHCLHASETGTWLDAVQIGVKLARAVKILHRAGLAHADLSPRSVLIDPHTRSVSIVDIDELVIEGCPPPEVPATPGFEAPELVAVRHLDFEDPARKVPDAQTNLHALAVLLYTLLLHRHPLRGGKVHDADPQRNERLQMGGKALFIEQPADASNRPDKAALDAADLPWGDVTRLPYTLTGPHLAPLFLRAFTTGLRSPAQRPTATEWETALLRTADALLPCSNIACREGWFVYDGSARPACPFCRTPLAVPFAQLRVTPKDNANAAGATTIVVFPDKHLAQWHADPTLRRDETLTAAQKIPVGYFSLYGGRLVLVNQTISSLTDVRNGKAIPPGSMITVEKGLVLDTGTGKIEWVG